MQRMRLLIFNMWHKKGKKENKGYKEIHTFTKILKTKKMIIIMIILIIILIIITITIIIEGLNQTEEIKKSKNKTIIPLSC